MEVNEESDFSKVKVKQEKGWSIEKVAQETSDCSKVLDIKQFSMEVNRFKHYPECAIDIKSPELKKERSEKACEQRDIKEDAEDIKYINTQEYLDIKESVLGEWNRAAPDVPSSLGFIKEEHTDPDHAQILAEDGKIRELILSKIDVRHGTTSLKIEEEMDADTRIINTQDYLDIGDTVVSEWNRAAPGVPTALGFIKEEHTDSDDAQILAEEEKIKELILNKIEVRHGTTSLKIEEEMDADTRIIVVKTDVDGVVGAITSEVGEDSNRLSDSEQVASRRVILHRLPTEMLPTSTTTSGGADKMIIDTSDNDNKSENKVDKTDVTYVLLKQPTTTTNKALGKKINVICETSDSSSRSSLLKERIQKYRDDKPYKCGTCDFKCAQSSNLKRHVRRHTGEKPYTCETCDFKSAQLSHLKQHMRTHTGEKPYKCETCDFKSTRSSDLKVHMRKHTGEQPFKCEICDYKCSSSSVLKRHLRRAKPCNLKLRARRQDDKPYKCETCGFRSAQLSNLKSHIRTHTGEKPYKCETCDFKSTRSCDLKVHMRIHTGEKPYICETCNFMCTNSRILKRHLRRRHTGEKLYKCETADFQSTS